MVAMFSLRTLSVFLVLAVLAANAQKSRDPALRHGSHSAQKSSVPAVKPAPGAASVVPKDTKAQVAGLERQTARLAGGKPSSQAKLEKPVVGGEQGKGEKKGGLAAGSLRPRRSGAGLTKNHAGAGTRTRGNVRRRVSSSAR